MNDSVQLPHVSNEQMVGFIKTATWEELLPVIQALAERIYEHRKSNKGYAPPSVFEWLLGMGGVTVSVQIVNEVIDRGGRRIGFALKQREATEAGADWANLYHSTCCTMLLFDTPEMALGRDTKDAFGCVPTKDEVEFLGVTIHDEPERRSACVTIMHRRKITERDLAVLQGTWRVFSEDAVRDHHKKIVDHNWYLLEWVMDENRPRFADVRRGWHPQP